MQEISKIQPDHEAILYRNQRLSYGELNNYVDTFVGSLLMMGVKPGDRVVISLPNCLEFVISYYGVLRMNGVVVPVNPEYTPGELNAIINDCRPVVVITSDSNFNIFGELQYMEGYIPKFVVTGVSEDSADYISFNLMITSDNAPGIFHYGGGDVVELLYTSGTTGVPKGAMLTHDNLFSNASTIAKRLEMTNEDRVLLVAPAYHAAAQTVCMNNAIVSGATLVIHSRWQGPKVVLNEIEQEEITLFFGPPIFYVLLCNYPKYNEHNINTLKICISGASPLPEQIFNRFKDLYGVEITEGYGLSETSPVVSVNPPYGIKKIGSVGLPIANVEVRIVDDNNRILPLGQVGEIAVRGPNVMVGYYNKEAETQRVLNNGWFHTGDLGYVDEDGYVFIVDRKKDLIIRGGINIYPREVEEVLHTHGDVLEVAVIGVPDELHGEEVKAFIVTRSGNEIDAKNLREFCKDRIANFKIPKYFTFVDSLPKNSSGKILKKELRNK